MRKRIQFDKFYGTDWPDPKELEPYFLTPPSQQWFYSGGNDGAALSCEGVDGTEHLRFGEGRIEISLLMWGNPDLGVFLLYSKLGGPDGFYFSSKGDLTRLGEYTRTSHGDLRPIGLYIPFDKAWLAVKEFMETEGELPKSIEWISNKDLPPGIFPDQHDERFRHVT